MKLKLLILLTAFCGSTNAQNPTANFGCSTESFDTSNFQCWIRFEDLSSDSDGSVLSQVWDLGDPASGASNTSTAHFLHHLYSSIGSYTVTFSVMDNDGNVDTLRAINCIVVDSFGCSCNYPTNIFDISEDRPQFQIYPNPTMNSFTIKNIHLKQNTLLQIVNPLGEIVYSEELYGNNENRIDANLAKGIYFVHVRNVKINAVEKLIIE